MCNSSLKNGAYAVQQHRFEVLKKEDGTKVTQSVQVGYVLENELKINRSILRTSEISQ